MKEFVFSAAVGVLAVGSAVAAAPQAPADQEFAAQAYQFNVNEIREARLAMSDSSNADVVAFARMMIDDHATANVELAAAARRAGIPLPQNQGVPPPDPQLDRLRDAAGNPNFNKRYFSEQVRDHEEALALLQTEASHGTSPEMRAFADRMIPIVRKHLDRAREVLASLPLAAPEQPGVSGTRTDRGGSISGQSGTEPLSGTPPINPVASPGPSASPGPASTGGGGAVPAPTHSPNPS